MADHKSRKRPKWIAKQSPPYTLACARIELEECNYMLDSSQKKFDHEIRSLLAHDQQVKDEGRVTQVQEAKFDKAIQVLQNMKELDRELRVERIRIRSDELKEREETLLEFAMLQHSKNEQQSLRLTVDVIGMILKLAAQEQE